MQPVDGDVDRSASLAGRLLAPLGGRWLHVEAVARRAVELSTAVPAGDRYVLVCAAWLHDIGYAPELRQSGFHPLDGARYLAAQDYPDRVVRLVANHSCALYEAAERGLQAEMAGYPPEAGAVAEALTAADITTGPDGQLLLVEDRIANIFDRYDQDSPVYQALLRSQDELRAAVRNTLARMGSQSR